jgi:ATP-dependent RNA helicase RhlE
MTSVLIFARTKRKTTWVMNKLRYAGVRAEEIHGDISQSQREKTLKGYRDGLFPVLVATDVASRGLDIPTITHVVNYDLPENAEDYVHRIGRTGRAGREGMALSLVSIEQRHLLRDIEKLIGPQNDIDSGTVKKVAGRRFRPRYGGRR